MTGLREIQERLDVLLRRGQIPGPWDDDQVVGFNRVCSEFIGEYGDEINEALARVASLESALAETLSYLDSCDAASGFPSTVVLRRKLAPLDAALASLREQPPEDAP